MHCPLVSVWSLFWKQQSCSHMCCECQPYLLDAHIWCSALSLFYARQACAVIIACTAPCCAVCSRSRLIILLLRFFLPLPFSSPLPTSALPVPPPPLFALPCPPPPRRHMATLWGPVQDAGGNPCCWPGCLLMPRARGRTAGAVARCDDIRARPPSDAPCARYTGILSSRSE